MIYEFNKTAVMRCGVTIQRIGLFGCVMNRDIQRMKINVIG